MPVKVITDSASNLYKELLEEYDIEMVTMNYTKNGVPCPCYDPTKSYDEQGKEFYDSLRNGDEIKTSLATPAQYADVFSKYLDLGYDVLYFSISSKLSGTLNSATNAMMMLEDDYEDRKIRCVDSMSASFGEAIIVMEAAKLAKEGLEIDEIIEKVNKMRLNIRNEFTVDDIEYLKTGGRIQSILFKLVEILDIKPMLRASKEATIESCGKVRGRKRSLRRLAEIVKETIVDAENQTIYIAHCDCKEDAMLLSAWIKELVSDNLNIVISMYDFCTGAHVGPGAIAVFYKGIERQ